jgi:hypothetical protein
MSADPVVADRLRAACEPLHPSDALRDAVLADLAPQLPRSHLVLVLGTVAAGALVSLAVLRPWEPSVTTRVVTERLTIGAEAKRDLDAIEKERSANLLFYRSKNGEDFRSENDGMWVAIADGGDRRVVATTLEAVIGPDDPTKPAPKHRFVFRLGEEGDKEDFVSSWYAPRFAGMGLPSTLGIDATLGDGVTLKKGAMSVEFHQPTPFPRIRLEIGTPDGKATLGEGPATPEVFLGSVGPTLMLTPQDDERLDLARWEVPGRHVVAGVLCRRVLVRVAVPGLAGAALVVAAVPDVAYERLVAMARSRNRFWEWSESLKSSLGLPTANDPRGTWVVFGNDRILGRGKSAEEAIGDADTGRAKGRLVRSLTSVRRCRSGSGP